MSATQLEQGIDHLVEALQLIPEPHLVHITQVPIMIVTRKPGGNAGGGGWYPPTGSRTTMAVWMRPQGERRTHIPPDKIRALPHAKGIIAVPSNRLKRRGLRQFTLLHEVGHCIDFHGAPGRLGHGLDSRGMDARYRRGNLAYQGQKYGTDSGYNPYEFKAETYSRAFLRSTRLCRQADANPVCRNHAGHSRCSERLQRDLANSPAFQSLGGALIRYLPLVADASSRTGEESGGSTERVARWEGGRAPGPIGKTEYASADRAHLADRACGRIPGPVGRSTLV